MVPSDIIEKINQSIDSHFADHPEKASAKAKDFMPGLISAGVFAKDFRSGKPLRDLLRVIDKEESLHLLPKVYPIREDKKTFWKFYSNGVPEITEDQPTAEATEVTPVESTPEVVAEVAAKPAKAVKAPKAVKASEAPAKEEASPDAAPKKAAAAKKTAAPKADAKPKTNDEAYVIDLCDKILGVEASRQHRFDFLKGDLHTNGKTRTKLPCAAFYESLNMVVLYNDKPAGENTAAKGTATFDRNEQRLRYDDLRRTVLPENGIKVVEISFEQFECDGKRKIVRDAKKDKATVSKVGLK